MDNSVREITEQLCRETGEIECTNTCYIQPQSPFDMIPTDRLPCSDFTQSSSSLSNHVQSLLTYDKGNCPQLGYKISLMLAVAWPLGSATPVYNC